MMHPQIDRYIVDVLRRLPESDHQRAREDLKKRILSLLPSEPTDADVDRVIAALGLPWDVSEQYKSNKSQCSVNRIPRSEVIFSMIATVLFTILFVGIALRFSQYIAWYSEGKPVIPVFHAEILHAMVPLGIALATVSLLVSAGKLVYGHWNLPMAWFNAFYNGCSTAFALYFLHSDVFNDAFVEKIGMMFSAAKDQTHVYFDRGLLVLSIVIVVAIAWDTGFCFYRAYRNKGVAVR